MTSEKIDQVKGWLGEITPWSRRGLHVVEDTGWVAGTEDFEWRLNVDLYTEKHKYRITAVDRRNSRAYLGCIASLRSPRLGECWRRGTDLPDGELNRGTWDAIKNSIIAYELVDPAPKETPANATFEVLAKALLGAFITADMTRHEGHWAVPSFAAGGSEDIPKRISRRVTNCLCSVMRYVPIEMLPELLVSKDPRVATAASRQSRRKGRSGAIERFRLLVTERLNQLIL